MNSVLQGRYAVTMDMWPLQSADFNRIHPFYDHLRQGRLTTTKCRDCGRQAFPPRVICPGCLSENLEWVDLPVTGRVLVATEEEVGVPVGFESPLIHALIDLGGQIILFARVKGCSTGELKEGDEVRLVVFPVDPLPVDGRKGETILQERVFFAFEKV
ncbi:MAG: zinc ribbon domain-containing protein [Peptococcaceae bacterium]|nr:zinc ribbon domain-containing protein [Peptococcaceae bacterium]